MTDMFVLLQLPNAGDDLQAIKKGVMELADLVVINKADMDPDRRHARPRPDYVQPAPVGLAWQPGPACPGHDRTFWHPQGDPAQRPAWHGCGQRSGLQGD
jgi:LAO/AO transport system kinase